MDIFSSGFGDFLSNYGYLSAFLSMVFLGPIGAIASGFFASTGIFSIWLIYLLSVAADMTSDIFFYFLGRYAGKRVLGFFAAKFSKGKILEEKVERLFAQHGRKTILIVKFTQGLGIITQLAAGLARMKFPGYISFNAAGAAVKGAVFVFVGFTAGAAWQAWAERFRNISLTITAVLVSAIVLYFFLKYIENRFAERLKDE